MLLDGDDPKRTNPTGDKDDTYEKLYNDQVIAAAAEAALEEVAVGDADVAVGDEAAPDETGGEQ